MQSFNDIIFETTRCMVESYNACRQHSFVEIDHEIFSMILLSLPVIQEGHCQFLANECAQVLVNPLED